MFRRSHVSSVVSRSVRTPQRKQHAPWNIPETPNQQFMKDFLSIGRGMSGICSRGMLGFSYRYPSANFKGPSVHSSHIAIAVRERKDI